MKEDKLAFFNIYPFLNNIPTILIMGIRNNISFINLIFMNRYLSCLNMRSNLRVSTLFHVE